MENNNSTTVKETDFYVTRRHRVEDILGRYEIAEEYDITWGDNMPDMEPLDRHNLIRLRDMINAILEGGKCKATNANKEGE